MSLSQTPHSSARAQIFQPAASKGLSPLPESSRVQTSPSLISRVKTPTSNWPLDSLIPPVVVSFGCCEGKSVSVSPTLGQPVTGPVPPPTDPRSSSSPYLGPRTSGQSCGRNPLSAPQGSVSEPQPEHTPSPPPSPCHPPQGCRTPSSPPVWPLLLQFTPGCFCLGCAFQVGHPD